MTSETERELRRILRERLGPRSRSETEAEPPGERAEELLPAATVSDAEKLIFQLQAELERVLVRLADFEQRYQMSFEEFQARLHPGSPPEIEQDCLEWCRW